MLFHSPMLPSRTNPAASDPTTAPPVFRALSRPMIAPGSAREPSAARSRYGNALPSRAAGTNSSSAVLAKIEKTYSSHPSPVTSVPRPPVRSWNPNGMTATPRPDSVSSSHRTCPGAARTRHRRFAIAEPVASAARNTTRMIEKV